MSFFDDLGAAVGSGFCTWLGAVGNAEAWLQRSAGFPVGGVGAGIRGALCNDPTPPPSTPPPFEGGQCPDAGYNVDLTWEFENDGAPSNITTQAIGPIGLDVRYDAATDQYIGRLLSRAGTPNESIAYAAYSSGVEPTSALSIVDVRRSNGTPDDCGDPPAIIPEFEPPDIPITVPDPDGGPDIDFDLTINAPIVIGPNIFAPITITGPDITFEGTINLNPEFGIEIGSGFGSGGGGSGTEVEGDDDDIDPGSPDEPAAADGREIIGLIVNLSFGADILATELAQDGDLSSIGVPRVAIAYLISNNGGVRVPLSGIDLKSRQTYIPVPPGTEVVSWRIHTEPGVTVTQTRPVYGTTRFPGA